MAGQLAAYLSQLLEAFSYLPKDAHKEEEVQTSFALPPQFGSGYHTQALSKVSREAARFLHHYYEIQRKGKIAFGGESKLLLDLAKLIDSCLQIQRVLEAVPLLKHWLELLKQGKATAEDMKRCLRQIGIQLTYLPMFEDRECELVCL
jgi:hypothetical protein